MKVVHSEFCGHTYVVSYLKYTLQIRYAWKGLAMKWKKVKKEQRPPISVQIGGRGGNYAIQLTAKIGKGEVYLNFKLEFDPKGSLVCGTSTDFESWRTQGQRLQFSVKSENLKAWCAFNFESCTWKRNFLILFLKSWFQKMMRLSQFINVCRRKSKRFEKNLCLSRFQDWY